MVFFFSFWHMNHASSYKKDTWVLEEKKRVICLEKITDDRAVQMFPHLPPHSPHRNQIFWLYPPTSMSFIPIFLISIFLIMVYFCLFIYFIFGCTGSSLLAAGFLSFRKAGATLWLWCLGFPLRRPLLLWSTGSRALGLQ